MADECVVQEQKRGKLEANHQLQPPRRTLDTNIPHLRLVAISPDDADAYYALVDLSRRHLTQHGDWTDLGEATPTSVRESLHTSDSPDARFGIWLDGQLIGRADLNPRTPVNFVLGYWLGSQFTGRGYATAACRDLIATAK